MLINLKIPLGPNFTTQSTKETQETIKCMQHITIPTAVTHINQIHALLQTHSAKMIILQCT